MIHKDLTAFAKSIKHSKIKIEENGRKAIFLNATKETFHLVQVDGALLKNVVASDFVLAKLKVGDLVIELKGMDVDHAVEQVFETASYWRDKNYRQGGIAALIVSSRVPAFNTKIAKYAARFKKSFNGPLHVVSQNREFTFERALSFDGPG
ncbi:hypothetical protein [Telluria beijingensis]|uniref:hypothetical protein n=1 Tax=Telluria beijingensis TaxID=3068633 RepID=UPI002795FC02|nr:hypothetical protein [Massilia sp. REN29]